MCAYFMASLAGALEAATAEAVEAENVLRMMNWLKMSVNMRYTGSSRSRELKAWVFNKICKKKKNL